MLDSGGTTDLSAIIRRRKTLAFSTFAAQLLSVEMVAVVGSSAVELIDRTFHWIPPVQLAVLVVAGIAFVTFRAVRRLRWGDRRVAWTFAAIYVPYFVTTFVGLPLQASGALQSSFVEGLLRYHDGFGEG